MAGKKETLSIVWCDNGSVDSLFMGGMINTLLNLKNLDIELDSMHNIIGNLIYKQRQQMADEWINTKGDWLLWVDSDVVISPDILKKLWDTANKVTHPVVCGVYFVTPNPNMSLMTPVPCIFTDDGEYNAPIHPLPENQVIKIDTAGLGLCLMHRSVLEKLEKPYDGIYFDVSMGKVNKSEDISFFRKLKEQGIPVHAHTGAIAPHIKRFSFDENYYKLWWNNVPNK